MEKITKEFTVYQYDELSEKAKEKVRNYLGENDYQFENDMLDENFKNQIEEIMLSDKLIEPLIKSLTKYKESKQGN